MNVWQDRSFQNKGKGYVAVIRIDGPIYGGAGSESVLNSSEGVSSEDLMRQFQAARKDPQAKAILVRINSPGGSTGATQEIAEEMDKVRSSGKPIIISMGICAHRRDTGWQARGIIYLLLLQRSRAASVSIWTIITSRI